MTRKGRSYDGFRRGLRKSTSLGSRIPRQYSTFSTQCVQSVELSAKIRLQAKNLKTVLDFAHKTGLITDLDAVLAHPVPPGDVSGS